MILLGSVAVVAAVSVPDAAYADNGKGNGGGNGNGGTTAWWAGRIVGGWSQAPDGEVLLQLLEDVGAEATAALEREAARLTAWVDGVRVAPRFPSPLSRSASG
mgnify:CR=1 FL=1